MLLDKDRREREREGGETVRKGGGSGTKDDDAPLGRAKDGQQRERALLGFRVTRPLRKPFFFANTRRASVFNSSLIASTHPLSFNTLNAKMTSVRPPLSRYQTSIRLCGFVS